LKTWQIFGAQKHAVKTPQFTINSPRNHHKKPFSFTTNFRNPLLKKPAERAFSACPPREKKITVSRKKLTAFWAPFHTQSTFTATDFHSD